jgi:ribosomal protein L37AE/L43A
MTCTYDPRDTRIEVGMHHCPECGEMVVAGCAHPATEQFAPIETTNFDQARLR